ncbi:hypothetical protein SALBM311S_08842 [Streptomyces alboniger]
MSVSHGKRRCLRKGICNGYAAAAEDVWVRQAAGVGHGVNLVGESSPDIINSITDENDRAVPDGPLQHRHVLRERLSLTPGRGRDVRRRAGIGRRCPCRRCDGSAHCGIRRQHMAATVSARKEVLGAEARAGAACGRREWKARPRSPALLPIGESATEYRAGGGRCGMAPDSVEIDRLCAQRSQGCVHCGRPDAGRRRRACLGRIPDTRCGRLTFRRHGTWLPPIR